VGASIKLKLDIRENRILVFPETLYLWIENEEGDEQRLSLPKMLYELKFERRQELMSI
jgi:hypothetical protein